MRLLFDIEKLDIPDIQGLSYIENCISEKEEKNLLEHIDQEIWNNELKRRVQHYGYKYDYKARKVLNDSYLGTLPDWLESVTKKLSENNFKRSPDQAIINEYLPGQGISPHIDCEPCFDDQIASLSLASDTIMFFTKDNIKKEILLKRRSLIILSGEARYEWKHGIPARKSDLIHGCKIERGRRVSITFRKVIL
jgi:alkylated DNA repair dioxygenase AlkB